MTDEFFAATPKKRGGWPKGKPRPKASAAEAEVVAPAVIKAPPASKSMLMKMRSRPNWDDDTITTVGDEGADRLRIPPEIVQGLARDGVALQWITRTVRGQEAPQEVTKFTKGGWTPVYQSDFDGVLDGMFLPKGIDDVIGVEDAMLVARPMAIHQKSKAREAAMAREPVQIKEAELGAGINVPGGNHPTATRQNRISRSVERIEIPKE